LSADPNDSKHEIEEQEDSFEEIDADSSPTVDDFIKELEAKGKGPAHHVGPHD